MDRITKGYMNNFAASQELTGQNESELFELFACYCVLSKEYPEHFDISDIVTGGGSDAGIDGIAIIANNVLIHSQEEFDDLAEQTHTITDLKFIFIQAKTSPTFNGGDIATFGFGVCDLLKEQAYLGILPACQFLNLVSNEDGIIKSILYDNVRDFQGENDVNVEIAETLNSSEADKFVILNNGITIICKELKNIVRNQFSLEDYQIVNGCQTSHVLYNNKETISDKVYVAIKIISTDDEETVNKIVKATNRQTEVTDEQLLALNDFNKRLEAYYQTYSGVQRLYYERRSKQYTSVMEIEKVRIVTVATQIKAFSSMFLDKPQLASRYYGRLLKDSKDSGEIFNTNHQFIAYYVSAYALYRIEFLIRNKQIDQQYNKYRYHILMILKYLVLGDQKQPQLNSHKMETFCQEIQGILADSNKLNQYVEFACKIISDQVGDLSNAENAKTALITDKLKNAAMVVKL